MKMTPVVLILGGLMVFWASVFVMVFMPAMTFDERPSDIWVPRQPDVERGHRLYVENGCSYCHSLYVRNFDWGLGSERITKAGDYYDYLGTILGTERTGPDLAQEGGEHPDDWHTAHFVNPRYTSPVSVMPSWEFLGDEKIQLLTRYVQSLGGTMANERMDRQRYWQQQARAAYARGFDHNVQWLHEQVPAVWMAMPNPYPPEEGALQRGKVIYQNFCIGCHGAMGDGNGPAAPYMDPPPFNFTLLRRNLWQDRYLGGMIYYQVMNGVTGTPMPYFKRALESAKIWDVSNYVAVYFVGYSDGDIAPEGIDAAYEPVNYRNPYKIPTTRPTPPMPRPWGPPPARPPGPENR